MAFDKKRRGEAALVGDVNTPQPMDASSPTGGDDEEKEYMAGAGILPDEPEAPPERGRKRGGKKGFVHGGVKE
jgi:hypothetical protein